MGELIANRIENNLRFTQGKRYLYDISFAISIVSSIYLLLSCSTCGNHERVKSGEVRERGV